MKITEAWSDRGTFNSIAIGKNEKGQELMKG
jgi:hypothetical protein